MPKTSIKYQSVEIGTIEFELTNIYAQGGPDFPLLGIHAKVLLSAFRQANTNPNQQGVTVRPISLVRVSGKLCSPNHVTVGRFQCEMGFFSGTDLSNPRQSNLQIEIPLDLAAIKFMEGQRGSDDLAVTLKWRLVIASHYVIQNNLTVVETLDIPSYTEDLQFSIPRSVWVDKLLPGLGYGGLEILEVRLGNPVAALGLPKSTDEVKKAKQYLLEGDWDKAVAHCRNAIEEILNSKPSTLPVTTPFRVKVDTFIQDNLKVSNQQAKLLAEHMRLLWETTSQAVHPTSAVFTRPDADYVVRSTMALIEYFSRLLTNP